MEPLSLIGTLGLTGVTVTGLRYLWRIAANEDTKRSLEAQVRIAEYASRKPANPVNYSPHISYSPHITNTSTNTHARAEAAPTVSESLTTGSTVPTFADLLSNGSVGKGNPLLLGYSIEKNKPIEGTWLDIYSTALGGVPHSGKTTTQRFLACQLALWGAKFVVCDPHAEAGEDSLAGTLKPLQKQFICDTASSEEDILDCLKLVDDMGKKRISGDKDRTPIILWIDELNGLLSSSLGPNIVGLLKETARAYRKVAIFLSASGHTWTASSTGGNTDLRANFASRMVHRMERQQARILLPTDMAVRAEHLDVGQFILHSMKHADTVCVPLTVPADVGRVAGLLEDNQPTMERVQSQSVRSHSEAGLQPRKAAETLSAETMRVRDMFCAGSSPAEIVLSLRGVRSNQGAKYQKSLDEILGLLREGMGQLI
jgi:hypothetical protein